MASQTYQLLMRSGPTPGKIFELSQAELTVGRDMINAGAGSLVLVCLTLWIAFRSCKLMLATIVSLVSLAMVAKNASRSAGV